MFFIIDKANRYRLLKFYEVEIYIATCDGIYKFYGHYVEHLPSFFFHSNFFQRFFPSSEGSQ